ncbi:MAG: 50S ribosomal protein L11 methyltransferase [Deltaproteobacteria bacterium]|nr:50S ribosomal protein L11 methyltransferase [Deltaproteobacteria bacterium]
MEKVLSGSPLVTPEWLEIDIHIHPIVHEAVGSFLFDLGCEGIVSDDFTRKSSIRAYLQPEQSVDEIHQRLDHFLLNLKEIFPEAKTYSLAVNNLENRDWSQTWKKFFKPDRITDRLTIIPAWESMPVQSTEHVIRIDPGPAFGTGQHASTRLCLEAMERISSNQEWTMLDVGTGSGILSIYGVKLGARRVVGIDIDPEALRWAEKNIALNGLSKNIELSLDPVGTLEDRFTMVVANLTRNVILELLTHFGRILKPEGRLILSGILKEQGDDIEKALADLHFQNDQAFFREEWACLIAKKIQGE